MTGYQAIVYYLGGGGADSKISPGLNKKLTIRCYRYDEVVFAVWRTMGGAVDNLILNFVMPQDATGFAGKLITFPGYIRYKYGENH